MFLFVAEGFDWVHFGGFVGWHDAKDDADDHREEYTAKDDLPGDEGWQFGENRNEG